MKPQLTKVQQAFLKGVRHGYRLGRKETMRDVEELMDELRAGNVEVRAQLNSLRAINNTVDAGRDPETSLH